MSEMIAAAVEIRLIQASIEVSQIIKINAAENRAESTAALFINLMVKASAPAAIPERMHQNNNPRKNESRITITNGRIRKRQFPFLVSYKIVPFDSSTAPNSLLHTAAQRGAAREPRGAGVAGAGRPGRPRAPTSS